MRRLCLVFLVAAAAASVRSEEPVIEAAKNVSARTPVIQDNSFLIEEAYNQEPGVVQHINLFQRDLRTNQWSATFTQEYPAPGIRHQLSYTIPYQRLDTGAGTLTGLGDIAVNYRYQLLGNGEARVAVAPRVTVFFPTGNSRRGLGAGSTGVQISLPASTILSETWITHWNAGATLTPSARNEQGEKANTLGYNFGASLIWLGGSFNALVETVWSNAPTVVGPRRTERQESFFVSPSVRWAYNFSSGLQIVPGLGFPIGVGTSRGQRSILLYLSFEHPFQSGARPESSD
jgi:outer membrane putative beta-barrel porin/alpha-amylase